ncbi:MAG: hypothetical protein E7A72_10865, partial [Actinomyces urogenitalis]|nr:hypothetical protein [Actinomyces urogenitalis]
AQADLIIGVGTRFQDFTTASWTLFRNPARKLVSINLHGYDASSHAARQVSASDIERTDLFVAAEQFHLDRLRALGAREEQLALMTDFDPESQPGAALPDPWYGGAEDFDRTLDVLERAMPRLAARLVKES